MPRIRPTLLAAAVTAAVAVAPASAELKADRVSLLDLRLDAPTAQQRTCSARALAPGAPGAIVRQIAAPLGGMLDARLLGPVSGGDWDLAVFDTLNGRLINGSATFGANEVVQAAVQPGQLLTVQACRREADAAPVRLAAGLVTVSGTAPAARPLKLVTVKFDRRQQIDRLVKQGIDFNHAATKGGIDAVLQGPADAQKIRNAGLDFTVKIGDLVAYDRKFVRTSSDPVTETLLDSGLPSGRVSYRHLIDYQNDLKRIVEDHPGLARPVTLPLKSVEGRTLEGIELAKDVARTDDGRPTTVQVGLHHVREWPSGEVTMEYGFTLANGAGEDARIDRLLAESRTFVIPVINPDGLEAAMMAGDSIPVYDDNGYTSLPLAVVGAGPYRRKNCRPTQPGTEQLPCIFKDGIDLNRNYGAFWGGPGSGASAGVLGQTYRGPAPFSEPETEAFHRFSAQRNVMVVMSNHTYAGDFLFQPGFGRDKAPGLPYAANTKPVGQQVPYQAQMKALSDAMAKAAGYVSMVSYDLYDVTGATEEAMASTASVARERVAFYGSTPGYRGVLEHHGWGDLQVELAALVREGRWRDMPALIDDEVLDAFAVVAPLESLADAIASRYDGVVDDLSFRLPGADLEQWAAVLSSLRAS